MKPEVLVFVMSGCPACDQLKPLAQQTAAHYGACVETKIINVDQDGGLSDAMAVDETPTVIGIVGKKPVIRMVGHDGKPARLVKVYATVLQGQSCPIGPFRDV